MADFIVKGFEAPESALRPDVQTEDDRGTERVKQLEDAALSTLPKEFKDYLDATQVEGFGSNSGFETRSPFLVFETRKKIFDTLKAGGDRYTETIGRKNSEFSRVESEVWNQRRSSTIKSIENRGVSAQASLLVAEGYEKILGSAMGQLESDWQKQAAAAEQYFENRGFWSKIGGLWRKKRFDRFNRRFTARLEKRKVDVQRSIDTIKGRKEREVKNAENLITAEFRDADDQRKEVLWKAVRDAVNDPNTNGNASASEFRIRTGYTDFLEAIKNKGMVEDVMRGRRSVALERDASTRIENIHNREEGLRALTPNFDKLKKDLIAMGINPSDEDLDTGQMARALEAELTGKGRNLDNAVYGGKHHAGLSSAEKLMYFSVYLQNTPTVFKGLDNEVKKKFLKYLSNLDKKTENDFEDTGDLAKAESGLKATIKNMKELTGQEANKPGNLQKLKNVLNTETFKAENFDATCSYVEKTFLIFDGSYDLYESLKSKFPPREQAEMDSNWKKLKTAREVIEKNIEQWKEDVKAYEDILKDKIPTTKVDGSAGTISEIARDHIDKATGSISTLKGEIKDLVEEEKIAMPGVPSGVPGVASLPATKGMSEKALNSQADQKRKEKEKLEEKITKINGAYDNWKRFHFKKANFFESDVVQVKELKFTPKRTSTINPDKKLKDRAKGVLVREFRDDITKEYLSFLEKNTTEQFDIIKKLPEGATVSLNFRETIANQLLTMPKNLYDKMESKQKLRVIRKEEDYILLEDKNKIYCLRGPSVKGGEAQSNLGIYNKVSKEGVHRRTLNAPPDFVIPHSNPNQQALVLSMQIS